MAVLSYTTTVTHPNTRPRGAKGACTPERQEVLGDTSPCSPVRRPRHPLSRQARRERCPHHERRVPMPPHGMRAYDLFMAVRQSVDYALAPSAIGFIRQVGSDMSGRVAFCQQKAGRRRTTPRFRIAIRVSGPRPQAQRHLHGLRLRLCHRSRRAPQRNP